MLFVLHMCLLRECDGVRMVWCMGCEELVEYVRCVCVWLGRRGWRRG